jgi:hypothetical protein
VRKAHRDRWVNKLEGQLARYNVKAPDLVPEHRFHAERLFRFDRAIPRLKIGIEVEGGIFAQRTVSRHTTGAGFQEDLVKYNLAALGGWLVLRYSTNMINSGEAAVQIADAVRLREALIEKAGPLA